MKLTRLSSTTQRPSQESIDRQRQGDSVRVRRVELLEGIDGDRQRTLQQEMAEIEPGAIATFEGGEQILAGARQLAAQVAALGPAADELIKPASLGKLLPGVDDQA
jgi:hypothetical protein